MMKKRMTPRLRVSLSVLVFAFAAMPVCAALPSTFEGIHIRYKGVSPYYADQAAASQKTMKAQCEQLQKLCAMPHVVADKPGMCAAVAGGYKFKGILADVGKSETNRYFATAMQMSAQYTKTTVLVTKSVCEQEVLEEETVKIEHQTRMGVTRFTLTNHPKKGRYWIREERKQPDSGTADLLLDSMAKAFPIKDTFKVSPVLGVDILGGHRCEIREISGPWTWTLCRKPTDTPFPGSVTLATKAVTGKTVLFEKRATEVAMKVVLPGSLFFPPAGDKIEIAGAKSTAGPMQKWCAKQKAKNGIDPCEDDPGDDGK
ncbi:MAG: hypothetical protein IV089_11905 [Thiobacillus sp.]|nr:hypothetical protein [Thiobacillus sp.]